MEYTQPEEMPVPQMDVSKVITSDEFAGKGGSYVFDPVSGTRTRAEGPEDPPVEQPAA